MRTLKILCLLMLWMGADAEASSLFLPDSDTAALVMLVSNTASTVTNTMKILEVAKKTSDQIDKFNFIAMRRFFIARRIEQHVQDIIATKKMKPRGLAEINQVLLHLKMNLQGLKSNIDFAAKDIFETENFVDRYFEKVENSMVDEEEVHNQELNSASEGEMVKHVQNTAMNTALSGKILSKIRRDNLEYQAVDLSLKKSEAVEAVRREEFYKRWLGLGPSLESPEFVMVPLSAGGTL